MAKNNIAATILIPTFDHGKLIKYAIKSVQNQTVSNIEIFVVGDGASEEGKLTVLNIAKKDPRIKFFENKKGPRHGEIHRHEALKKAKGKIVCYLSDDDLYFENHVETMLALLNKNDFASTQGIRINPDQTTHTFIVDLNNKFYFKMLKSGQNRIPLSNFGHTLRAYKKLPYGWRTTPKNTATDLYMIQQFLRQKDLRINQSRTPTVVHAPDALRKNWGLERREKEIKELSKKISSKNFKEEFITSLYTDLIVDHIELESSLMTEVASLRNWTKIQAKKIKNYRDKYNEIENSKTWRLATKLKKPFRK